MGFDRFDRFDRFLDAGVTLPTREERERGAAKTAAVPPPPPTTFPTTFPAAAMRDVWREEGRREEAVAAAARRWGLGTDPATLRDLRHRRGSFRLPTFPSSHYPSESHLLHTLEVGRFVPLILRSSSSSFSFLLLGLSPHFQPVVWEEGGEKVPRYVATITEEAGVVKTVTWSLA